MSGTNDRIVRNRPILLIESDPSRGLYLCEVCEAEGYRVELAGSWQTAAKTLESTTPDLILLNQQLPDNDFLSTLRSIRQGERTYHLPVILFDVRDDSETLKQCLQHGASYCLCEPFDVRDLLHKIRSAVFQRFELPPQARMDYAERSFEASLCADE